MQFTPALKHLRSTAGGGLLALLAGCATAPAPVAPSVEVVAPVVTAEGRVTMVNADLGFVVLDFDGAAIPAAGTTLSVYRNNLKIGQVRVTEPVRGTFTAADILSGELQAGDRAR